MVRRSNAIKSETIYTDDETGYNDYPLLDRQKAYRHGLSGESSTRLLRRLEQHRDYPRGVANTIAASSNLGVGVEMRSVVLNHAGLFQDAHPAVARGQAEFNPFRQLRDCQPAHRTVVQQESCDRFHPFWKILF